jgi:hypothetical protein
MSQITADSCLDTQELLVESNRRGDFEMFLASCLQLKLGMKVFQNS